MCTTLIIIRQLNIVIEKLYNILYRIKMYHVERYFTRRGLRTDIGAPNPCARCIVLLRPTIPTIHTINISYYLHGNDAAQSQRPLRVAKGVDW